MSLITCTKNAINKVSVTQKFINKIIIVFKLQKYYIILKKLLQDLTKVTDYWLKYINFFI